ncbi:hypothetical protein SK128_024806, partial [Halocaridina rubra]
MAWPPLLYFAGRCPPDFVFSCLTSFSSESQAASEPNMGNGDPSTGERHSLSMCTTRITCCNSLCSRE